MKLAIASIPKDGGTFTFYRNLRPALLKHGIDMRCVSVGAAQARLWQEEYADEGCVLLAPHTRDVKKQAMIFTEWCQDQRVDLVIGLNSQAVLSALPHLPEHIRVLARCANGFDHGYKITLSAQERLARIVALTPRLARDLVHRYHADPAIVRLIPNGIDPRPYHEAAATPRGQQSELQLGFLGRLEHNQKGVLHLPAIVRELNVREIPFKLRIAGKGKHRRVLEAKMSAAAAENQVEFLGALTPAQVPDFLAQTDLFLFTSHFEGCPNALLEAMMAGCVPLAWRIAGITDFILDQGKTGWTCATADYKGFARHIEALANDRTWLQSVSKSASGAARRRFTDEIAAAAYAHLLCEVMAEEPPACTPLPWAQFRPDPNFKRSWKGRLADSPLPRGLKKRLQNLHDLRLATG